MKPISKTINFQHGLVNAINPSLPGYPEGAAIVSVNSRIDRDGLWNKGPSLASRSGAPAVRQIDTLTGLHLVYLNVKGDDVVATGCGNDTTIADGPNGLAYYAESGTVYYWDGTTTAGTGATGLIPSTTSPTIAVSGTGARQEEGLYYYMYTIYNATRDVESLPCGYVGSAKLLVIEHWVGKRYEDDTRIADVPVLTARTPNTNKIRWYRSLKIDIGKGDTMQ